MKKLIIEKDKLKQNIETVKKMTDSTIIAVLKGNGYGLGILEFARLLAETSINFFAVSEIEEALCLRNSGIDCKILLLTSTCMVNEAELLIKNGIIPTVGSPYSAAAVNEAAAKADAVVDVHLKIDTGFGRFGFFWDEAGPMCNLLKSMENIKVTGTYSHLSFAFEKKPRSVYAQFEKFLKCAKAMREAGIDPGMLHLSNSCAYLRFPALHLDAVRVGSAFLGRLPLENRYGLNRIGYLKSNIIEVKELPKGSCIGYANTYKTPGITRIGIVPVGYMDGFGVEKSRDTFRYRDILRYIYNDLKSINKKLHAKLSDKTRVRILGRISMYNIVIDLTETDASIGDEVFLEANPVLVKSTIEREYV